VLLEVCFVERRCLSLISEGEHCLGTCHSATSPTRKFLCTGLGLNPGIRGGRPTNNGVSHLAIHCWSVMTADNIKTNVCKQIHENCFLVSKMYIHFSVKNILVKYRFCVS
jgi:hypothetical protein